MAEAEPQGEHEESGLDDASVGTIRDGIADLIEKVEPGLAERLSSDPEASVRLVEVALAVTAESQAVLQSAVDAARGAGQSWERVGAAIGTSRQAAQQRFGRRGDEPDDVVVWRMTPVTAFDEMDRLEEAGRGGWRSIGNGPLYHDLVKTDEQWEHIRVSAFGADRKALEADGWTKAGAMWFPWVYYARATGRPAEDMLPSPRGAAPDWHAHSMEALRTAVAERRARLG